MAQSEHIKGFCGNEKRESGVKTARERNYAAFCMRRAYSLCKSGSLNIRDTGADRLFVLTSSGNERARVYYSCDVRLFYIKRDLRYGVFFGLFRLYGVHSASVVFKMQEVADGCYYPAFAVFTREWQSFGSHSSVLRYH